jgi:glutamate N-acetyltransferase/amino-acid N-acetyltransferase
MVLPIQGFRFAAVSSGIRKDGRIDTALAVADGAVTAAGVVTRNLVKAAPILIAAERLRGGSLRAARPPPSRPSSASGKSSWCRRRPA